MTKKILICVAFAFVGQHVSAATVLGKPLAEASRSLGPADAKCHLAACFGAGAYALGATDAKTSTVYHYWKNKDFSLSSSRAIALRLVPADAKLVRSKAADSGTVVELYKSAELAKSFGPKSDVWADAPSGTFTVMHSPAGGKTIVSIGQHE